MTATSQQDAAPSIILGVPGQWKDRSHFLESVIKSSDFVYAANVLYHHPSKRALTVDLRGPDPRLQRAFTIAGAGRIPAADLEAIGRHTMVPYIIGPGGSFENAKFMVQAATALLNAGGMAVKIESTGLAHSRERWLELVGEELLVVGPDIFVVHVQAKNTYYSCGMHNLGFRDAVFLEPPANAMEMLHLFLLYSIHPKNPISDRDTVTLGNIKYRLHKTPCNTFSPDSPFYNPYGLWSIQSL